MAKKKYEEANIQAIADGIREKTGTNNTYDTSEMASGVNEVYEAGYDKAMLNWWDCITKKGERISCIRTFAATNVGDIEGIEKMPYPLVLTGQCDYMFHEYMGKKLLPKHLLDLTGIKNTYDNATVIYAVFARWTSKNAGTTEGVIPDYGIPAMSYYTQFCYTSSAVETIEVIRCHENTQFSSTFNGASNLKNITFEGVIGTNISFSSSPLTVESMKSIITHLKNYIGLTDDSGNSLEMKYTLTLKDTCRTNLETAEFTDEDKSILQENGIIFTDETSWISVIGDLKWNLVWSS